MKKYILFVGVLVSSAICNAVSSENKTESPNDSQVKNLISRDDNVDWTPVFKSWEKGCEFSDVYSDHIGKLFYFDDEYAEPFTGIAMMPSEYSNSYETKVERLNYPKAEDGAYTDFSFKVTGGTYYGMPVQKIGYVIGNSNGISAGYIETTPTDAQLREFLVKVEFKSTEAVMYEEYKKSGEYKYEEVEFSSTGSVKVEKDKVIISCDVST